MKNNGNDAYAQGNLQVAIECYTKAIELKENEIYYSNRMTLPAAIFVRFPSLH